MVQKFQNISVKNKKSPELSFIQIHLTYDEVNLEILVLIVSIWCHVINWFH